MFSPTDGSDYDVLVMQNAPADAGATNRKTFVQASAPANPGDDLHDGDLWFDSDADNVQYRWNGSTWVEVRDQGVGIAVALRDFRTARRALDAAVGVLERGELFGIYPEGTRSRGDGLTMGQSESANLSQRVRSKFLVLHCERLRGSVRTSESVPEAFTESVRRLRRTRSHFRVGAAQPTSR